MLLFQSIWKTSDLDLLPEPQNSIVYFLTDISIPITVEMLQLVLHLRSVFLLEISLPPIMVMPSTQMPKLKLRARDNNEDLLAPNHQNLQFNG